ncbi:MAG: protein YgfX [Thauera sp.]|jgi:hypothetical protein
MRFPVELRLQPSSMIMASVLVAHLAAALALFHVHAFVPHAGGAGDWLFAALGWALLVVSLAHGLQGQRRLRGCTMWLEEDGTLELRREGGPLDGLFNVQPGSQVVLSGAVWFAVRPLAVAETLLRRRGMALMLVSDNLGRDGFRLLRAWLLHRGGRTRGPADPA